MPEVNLLDVLQKSGDDPALHAPVKGVSQVEPEPPEWGQFMHYTISEGQPTLVDGEKFSFEIMRDSAKKVLKEVEFDTKADRNTFLQKVCMAFGFPTDFTEDDLKRGMDSLKIDVLDSEPTNSVPLSSVISEAQQYSDFDQASDDDDAGVE